MKNIFFSVLIGLMGLLSIKAQTPSVYVTIFTHIEDNTPIGIQGSTENRQQYMSLRSKLIELARLVKQYNLVWCFQPDWKILLAALQYEDAATMASSGGKNFLRYLKEDFGVVIDPHSHEKQGYNYTDVAHLLDSLGVGGSTVIGGHVWDPTLPQFQNWDRYRNPVRGTKYPWAIWRGDILMGSGTPNHVNDPLISGIWRPKDKNNYFTDDINGNIVCIGKYKEGITPISELVQAKNSGQVPASCLLTASHHINPSTIQQLNGLKMIEDTVLKPLAAMQNRGEIKVNSFSTTVQDWKTRFGSNPCMRDSTAILTELDNMQVNTDLQVYPNPFIDQLQLKNGESCNCQLLNAYGQCIWAGKLSNEVSFAFLPNGMYWLLIQNGAKVHTVPIQKKSAN